MTLFRVWAPHARTVELEWQGGPTPMTSLPGGYFCVDLPKVGKDTAYRFIVDRGAPRPDPRSPWQPRGVFGPSTTVDHDDFPWTDQRWSGFHLPSSVLYELHVGTFSPGGTFDGVAEKLDHLLELGVSAIELMPVAEFPGDRGWGYDGVALYAPHHAYGPPSSLKRLIDVCHAKGLGVILDVVYNHLGPAGNHLLAFGPYFTDRYKTPWGPAMNLDGEESGPVRDFVCDNALMWLRDYHFDGLRLDAVHAIVDTSAVHILEELHDRVERLSAAVGRPLWLIAESDRNDPRVVQPKEVGGYGMDAQWVDDFHHALHTVLTGERQGYYEDFGTLADLAAALTSVFVYAGRYSSHRKRVHGRPAVGLSGERFVVFHQNHDQIGNRAEGDRTSALLRPGQLKIASALLLTSPFIPLLFQGEEWGSSSPFLYFTDHRDEELRRAVREGRMREFAAMGWDPETLLDPSAPEAFERSRLVWEERRTGAHADLFAWYRSLLQLRRSHPDLAEARAERPHVRFDEARAWMTVERGDTLLACNFSGVTVELPLLGERAGKLLLASNPPTRSAGGPITLPPESVAFFG